MKGKIGYVVSFFNEKKSVCTSETIQTDPRYLFVFVKSPKIEIYMFLTTSVIACETCIKLNGPEAPGNLSS